MADKDDLITRYYKRHHAGADGTQRYGFTIGGDERANWFRRHIGAGTRLLDIGCRDGTMTNKLSVGHAVTGIDIDDDALALANRNHGISTRKVDLNREPLPFDSGSFDVVVAGEILEHLQFPEHAVSEIYRVLASGGVFVGSVPNAFRVFNRVFFLLGKDFENDPTHLHHFSPDSVKNLLSSFANVEVDFICSRHLWLSPRLMGTDLVWVARK